MTAWRAGPPYGPPVAAGDGDRARRGPGSLPRRNGGGAREGAAADRRLSLTLAEARADQYLEALPAAGNLEGCVDVGQLEPPADERLDVQVGEPLRRCVDTATAAIDANEGSDCGDGSRRGAARGAPPRDARRSSPPGRRWQPTASSRPARPEHRRSRKPLRRRAPPVAAITARPRGSRRLGQPPGPRPTAAPTPAGPDAARRR